MSTDLAVLVIHGMGAQKRNFADEMIEELNDRIYDLDKDPKRIEWKSIYWANILEGRQQQYLKKAKKENDLDYIPLREFMISAFGDASAYQKVKSTENTTYEMIHNRVRRDIKDLYEERLKSESKPLLIIAHSLGGHIMSNYIWDMQHSKDPNLSSFEHMENLAGIITFGCNIPLFSFAYEKVEPIEFPPKTLSEDLYDKARWLNYYDPDDVLGYPLKSINQAYNKTVDKDIPINVGGIFSSWNPLAHSEYWTDNDFTKPVARFIASFCS